MTKSVGDRTRKKILEAGLSVWPNISLSEVARAAGIAHSGILYHFPQNTLFDSIAKYAVEVGNSRVIVQLIAIGHASTYDLSLAKKYEHFQHVQNNLPL